MCVSGGRLSQPAFILFKVFLSVAASVCVEQIKIKGRPGGANSKDCALKFPLLSVQTYIYMRCFGVNVSLQMLRVKPFWL